MISSDASLNSLVDKGVTLTAEHGFDLVTKGFGLLVVIVGLFPSLTAALNAIRNRFREKKENGRPGRFEVALRLHTSGTNRFFSRVNMTRAVSGIVLGGLIFFGGPLLVGLVQISVYLVLGILALLLFAIKLFLDHRESIARWVDFDQPAYQVRLINGEVAFPEELAKELMESENGLNKIVGSVDDGLTRALIFVQLLKTNTGYQLRTFIKCSDLSTRDFLNVSKSNDSFSMFISLDLRKY